MPLPALHLRRKQAIVKMGNGPDGACSGAQGTPCRLAMITAQIQRRNALRFVIARPRRGRGNLGKAVSFSPMAFLRSGYDLRDCTPRALPRASRSGRHVGLRPPRNDKLGGLAPLNCCCTTCNCLRRSGNAAAAEPSKYPGMHPRKCGKAVAVGGFTKRSKKTSVWVLTKLRLGGIVSLALRGTEC